MIGQETSVRLVRINECPYPAGVLKAVSTVATTANLSALDLASLRKPTPLQALVSPVFYNNSDL